ncbi:unnamed protein product [Caenorhabditis bovis]|uniref:Uncharacterized protein n=1 Tax=Caenorhabditis bovis TaxID=2654633 RepID=A0A8S1ER50_9PELO|nr:unnamed protein product [Caenorhabditis bovis]
MSSLRQHQNPAPDLESGEGHHANKRPYTPGASPREILLSQSHRGHISSSQYSPHGSRFMEGYRRRIRQASLNLPSDTKLDEDLGFPPVCSPPPEVFSGTVGDNRGAIRMRDRSLSDAVPSMLGISNGGGASGGLLVFFPTSPSSSGNIHVANSYGISSSRRESSTDETIPQRSNWTTGNSMDDDESKIDIAEDAIVAEDILMKEAESSGLIGRDSRRSSDIGVSLWSVGEMRPGFADLDWWEMGYFWVELPFNKSIE